MVLLFAQSVAIATRALKSLSLVVKQNAKQNSILSLILMARRLHAYCFNISSVVNMLNGGAVDDTIEAFILKIFRLDESDSSSLGCLVASLQGVRARREMYSSHEK